MAETMSARGVETESVPLREVLDAGIVSVRDTAPDVNMTVGDEIPPVTVFTDDMLDSAFQDLLMNAIQHIDEDGPTTDVFVTYAECGDRVVVRVADDGHGVLDRREDIILAKDGKGLEGRGTELRLYLVQPLVEKYGGDAWVKDNGPSGSIFAIELWLVDGGQSDSDQPSPTRS